MSVFGRNFSGGSTRNLFFRIHAWTGLHLSLILGFLIFTGALMVIADEIEVAFQPDVWVFDRDPETDASFGDIYASVKAYYPDARISRILKQPAPWLADRTWAHTRWGEEFAFWTRPSDGQVVGVTKTHNFRRIWRELHDTLFVPRRPVAIAVTATSVILLISIITGLVVYRRFWRGLFRWPRRGSEPRAWHAALHRVTALWSLPLLLVMALSSLLYFAQVIGFRGFEPRPAPATERQSRLPAGLDAAWIDGAEQKAVAALAGFRPTLLVFPFGRKDDLTFQGKNADDWLGMMSETVSLDPTDLSVVGAFSFDDFGGTAKWEPLADIFHFGNWGGGAGSVLSLFFGLVGTALVISGAVVFATRLAALSGQDPSHSRMRLFLAGLGPVKWLYLLLLIAVIAAGVLRHGPPSTKWVRIPAPEAARDVLELRSYGRLRAGKPITLRLSSVAGNAITARVTGETAPARAIDLVPDGDRASAEFTILASSGQNVVTVSLPGPGGDLATHRFRLGPPIW